MTRERLAEILANSTISDLDQRVARFRALRADAQDLAMQLLADERIDTAHGTYATDNDFNRLRRVVAEVADRLRNAEVKADSFAGIHELRKYADLVAGSLEDVPEAETVVDDSLDSIVVHLPREEQQSIAVVYADDLAAVAHKLHQLSE